MGRRLIVLLIVLSLAATITACGPRRPKGFPKVYPCSVRILQEGQPVDGAVVTFYPEDQELSQWVIGSLSDADGIVQMMTQTFPGAPLGKYKVTVAKVIYEFPEGVQVNPAQPPVPPDRVDYVNSVYAEKDSTTLSIEVVKGMKEPIDIEVGPKP